MAEDTKAPAPPRSRNTIVVGCKLPNGLQTRLYTSGTDAMNQRVPIPASNWVKLNGANTSNVVGGYGLTEVDSDYWEKWYEQNKDAPYVKNHLIFAEHSRERGMAHALDSQSITTGLEPIDPNKPRVRG